MLAIVTHMITAAVHNFKKTRRYKAGIIKTDGGKSFGCQGQFLGIKDQGHKFWPRLRSLSDITSL